ncbi:MAG: haloacid dehalogenase [Niastella sp. SCN 39-18]|nr:cation-translocating P-type ATPase [Sphingobacteriales bacterium]ODT53390.1 MAG: haloacid dehalogenase [Niastella sp. SCN 39-18]OJW07689.1 MAG: haloacid dehalogenase [Sphingobacteriales bacterium 39-19]
MNAQNPFPFNGLHENEILASRKKYGSNFIESGKSNPFWHSLKDAVTEPMFILLVAAAVIYFLVGEYADAWFMSGAIILVSAISIYQDNRSRNALRALKEFTQTHATVIRHNRVTYILAKEIVVGDYVVVSEGELIPADGVLKQLNDFSVNESILTGESLPVTKELQPGDSSQLYSGTLAVSGQCVYEVTAVGNHTELAKLGLSIQEIQKERTALQKQITYFVKWMAIIGAVIFLIIWGINFYQSKDVLDSLLKGLTIAMSVLPEEIPVALATFMALGAWRLMKLGIIVKDVSTVETLGAASIVCTDKTGTITENRMEIFQLYDFAAGETFTKESWNKASTHTLLSTAMWASESVPFNPMEKAIHAAYAAQVKPDRRTEFKMIHEYPLGGQPPMMTHIFENDAGERQVAVKGAPEAIIRYSSLADADKIKVQEQLNLFAQKGLRVLGVGRIVFNGNDFPGTQEAFTNEFLGLVGFYDPPKKNIESIFNQMYRAGIELKIITGDNPITTAAIAKQAHFRGYEKSITGTELVALNEPAFDLAVNENKVFTRMFPEVKLKIIQSLKKQYHIVAMTGDGVNDGPALKAADIGIAMGMRGSEIAKEASSIILTDDDFGKLVDAIAMGRKIYTNLKKAIQYIISIHIPIILIVALPLVLGWVYPAIFTPVHVIFLELIMGPTCSIVYENEPLEKNAMLHPPRVLSKTFFNFRELIISIIQGLAITAGTLFIYQYAVHHNGDEQTTRSMVFSTLIFANIFLTLVNRSFYYSIAQTLRYKNSLLWFIIFITLAMMAMMLYVPVLSGFFKISRLPLPQLGMVILTAFISVAWIELYKWIKRKKNPA